MIIVFSQQLIPKITLIMVVCHIKGVKAHNLIWSFICEHFTSIIDEAGGLIWTATLLNVCVLGTVYHISSSLLMFLYSRSLLFIFTTR